LGDIVVWPRDRAAMACRSLNGWPTLTVGHDVSGERRAAVPPCRQFVNETWNFSTEPSPGRLHGFVNFDDIAWMLK
jgi:hypothetical protein